MAAQSESINVSRGSREYLSKLNGMGLLTGDAGHHGVADDVRAALMGLHAVLAGGRASVSESDGTRTITIEGLADDPASLELDRLLDSALDDHNEMSMKYPGRQDF